MDLTLQLLLLFIGAGGSIVTAFTLPDSRSKWTLVSAFGLAGVAGFALTIVTYEKMTVTEAILPVWHGLQFAGARLGGLAIPEI